MSEEQSQRISVIEPIEPAIQRVKEVLFLPFDIGKWFVVGFCAWLAYLNLGGFNFRIPLQDKSSGHCVPAELKNFLVDYGPLVVALICVLVVLAITVFLVLLWLSSRGKFMFLSCVAQNKAEIKKPWHDFKSQGNSLFFFQLIIGMILLFFLLLSSVLFGIFIVFLRRTGPVYTGGLVALILLFSLIIVATIILFLVVSKLTYDFVIPIMFLGNCGCIAGWRKFMSILSANKGQFVLYLLFNILISMVITAIVLALCVFTCCCAACIFAIPYIGTVFMLPLFIFKRSYSLYYLRQFGSDYDVFTLRSF